MIGWFVSRGDVSILTWVEVSGGGGEHGVRPVFPFSRWWLTGCHSRYVCLDAETAVSVFHPGVGRSPLP
jgi:hypothetical protein